jgi:hypothetical protein
MDVFMTVAKIVSVSATAIVLHRFYQLWKIIGDPNVRLRMRWKLLPYLVTVFTVGYATTTVFIVLGDLVLITTVFIALVPWVFLIGTAILHVLTSVFIVPHIDASRMIDIAPVLERPSESNRLEPGTSYVVEEPKAFAGLRLFIREINAGVPGLIITRKHPDKVRKVWGIERTPVIWLSSIPGLNHLDPSRISVLRDSIMNFLDDTPECVIFLSGVELLVLNNDFPRVMKFLEKINEEVMERNSMFITSLDPRTFDAKEMAMMERGMEVVRTTGYIVEDDLLPFEPKAIPGRRASAKPSRLTGR